MHQEISAPLPDLDTRQAPAKFKALAMQAEEISDFLKAIAHEGRLLVLCLLADGEKSVSELEEIMSLPQSAVSQQLARLRLSRLVKARRDGRSIYYSIENSQISATFDTLHHLFSMTPTRTYS